MSKRRKKWEKTWSSSDSEEADEAPIVVSRLKSKRVKATGNADIKELSTKNSSIQNNQKVTKSKVEVKDEDPHLLKLRDTIYSPSSNSYYADLPAPRRRAAFFDETDDDESWKRELSQTSNAKEHEPLSTDDKNAIEPDSWVSNNNNNNNNTNNTLNNELNLGQGNRIQRAINEVRRVQHKTLSILQADEDSEVDSEDFYIYSSRLNSTLNKSLYNANTVSTYELFGNLEDEDPLVETKKPEEPRFPFLPYVSSDSDSESDDLRFGAEAMFPDEMENDEDKYYHRKQKNDEPDKRQNSDPLKTKQDNRDKLIRKCFGTSEMERKQRERSFHGSFSSGMQAFFLNIKDVESLEAQSESPSDVDDALQICLHENNVSIIVIGNEVRATVCSTYTVVLLMSPPMGVMNHRRLLNSVCSCQISNVNNNNLFCKHIVAVLLLSIFRPQKLLSVETIKKKLTSLSREELETILINQFVINPTQWTTFESSLSLVEKHTALMDLTQPLAITPIQPISEEQQVVLEKQLGHSVNDVDDIKQLIESALQQYEHIGAASGINLDLSLPREEGISLPSKLLGRILSDDAEKVANQQSPLQVAVKQVVAKSRQRWLACDYNSALLSLLTVSEYMVILYRKQKEFGILGPEHSVHPLYYGYRGHNPYSRKETVMTSLLQILNKVWVEYMISYPLSASSRMQWAEKLAEWGSLFSDAIPLAKNGWEDPNLKEIMNRSTIIETTSNVEPQDEEINVDMETDDKIASLLENMDSDPESTLLRSVSKYMLTKRAQDRELANLANSNDSDQIHPVLKESKEVLLTRIHYLLSKGLFTQSLNLSRSAGVVIGEAMSLIYMNHIQEGVLVALNKVEAVYDLYSLIHILKEHCPFGVFEIGTKLLKLLATRPKNTSDDAPYWKRAETEISATLTHNGKDIQLTPVSLAEFMIHYAHQKSHASEEPPVTTEKEGSTSMELEKAKLANVDSLTRLCARKVAIAYIEEPPHERFELLSSLAPELQSLIMIELLSLKLPDVLPSKDLTHCAKLFNKLGEYQVCFHLLVKSISAPPGSSDSSKVVLSNPIASDTLMWAADLACSFPGEREAFALAKELNKQATKSNLFRIAHAVGLSTYMLPGSCRGPTNVLNAKQLFDVARIFYRSKKYQASLAAAAGCFRVRRTYRYSYSVHTQDADKLQVLAWIIVRLLPVVDKKEDPIKTIVTQLLSSKVPSTMLFFVHYLLEMNKIEEDPAYIVQRKQQIQQLIERSLRCKKGIGRNFFELAQELHRHGDKVNALKLAIKSYGLRGFFQTSMPLPYGRERPETAVTPKNAYDWVLVHLEQLTDEELEQVCESRKFILSERTLAFAVAKTLEKRQFVDIAAEIALRSLDIPHTMMSTRPASSLGEIVAWLLVLLSEHPEVTESTRTKVKLLEPEALEKKCEELLNSSDCFVVSRNLYELGNKAGAFKLGQRALACSPRSVEIAEWLGTLAVELGQPVTAQITALVLFQEKPSLAHYKLLKERGVPSDKIEFLLMKVSKSTKDIGILEVLLQKLMWDDAFAFVDRFECNPKALKFLFEKLETSNNNNNNKNSTKLSISNSLRKELLQRCIQRLETFLFSFHWQNQGDIEENVLIMQELLPKYAPDLIEYFNCIQVVSRSINTLSASNAQYVRLITELESLYKILEKGGKYHVWRDIVDYVKAKHKLKKKLISMMNVKNW